VATATLVGALLLALTPATAPQQPASAQSPPDAAPAASASTPATPFGPPPLDATTLGVAAPVSAVLIEVATGQVLVARDAALRRPVASVLKLVTALAVVEALPVGSLVTVGEEVRGIEGASYGLRPGDVRSVEELLGGLLLRSGNDVAVALAVAIDGSEDAFTARMADLLARLGIEARPATASGLDIADAMSASDLAVVARAALSEPRIRDLVAVPVLVLSDGTTLENRNLFLSDVPGASGLKTGFTNAAGFTLAASAARDGRELVAVVLGAEDDRSRRDIAARLIEHGFTTTSPTTLRRSVTLRTASGPVRIATADTVVTLADGSVASAVWPATLRPDDTPTTIEVRVAAPGGTAAKAGQLAAERIDGRRAPEAPSLGRALADGVYAALRPYGLADALR